MNSETSKLKSFSLAIAIVIAVFSTATVQAQFNRPISIDCPYDGHPMSFEKTVGFGANTICWYQHSGPSSEGFQKHEAYIACPM